MSASQLFRRLDGRLKKETQATVGSICLDDFWMVSLIISHFEGSFARGAFLFYHVTEPSLPRLPKKMSELIGAGHLCPPVDSGELVEVC